MGNKKSRYEFIGLNVVEKFPFVETIGQQFELVFYFDSLIFLLYLGIGRIEEDEIPRVHRDIEIRVPPWNVNYVLKKRRLILKDLPLFEDSSFDCPLFSFNDHHLRINLKMLKRN